MFSTVLNCRQSLSEFSFCIFHMVTRLSARLPTLAGGSKGLTDFTITYRKALIPDGQVARASVLLGSYDFHSICFITSWPLLYLKNYSLYCYSLAGAWTGIDQW